MTVRRYRFGASIFGTGLALLAAACASGPEPSAGPAVPQACELRPGSARGGVLEVHAPGGIDPEHAPVPVTPAERIAFRHLYETLLVVDCTGARHPGLAGTWEPEDGGRAWRFTLREGASFWDGTPVRAEDVLASWRAAVSVQGGDPVQGLPSAADHRLRAATAASTEVVDARTLRVVLDRPASEPPAWLADPALAVHSSRPGNAWPSGTGAWRIHPEASLPGGDPTDGTGGRWVAWPAGWTPGDARPVLRFYAGRSADPRGLLDAGEDLLVTEDPAVLAYAATLPAVEALPLPWDRRYALLVEGWPAEPNADSAERALREALARDAVRAEARASEMPAPAGAASACESVAAPAALGVQDGIPVPPRSGATAQIIYPREDRTARELAERLVALAAVRPGLTVPAWVTGLPEVAGGLSDEAFAAALGRRSEAAFVLAVPRESSLPCALQLEPGPGRVLRPLVDARRRVIVVDDVAGLAVDGDGTLLLFGAGRTGEAP
ncbi:MAG: ABC transporter substrate-binding protein [marine benthic group bacterium]|jgi:hypothetical protein|nr:ABC transporter substrate-binding protein [Gemmatimonadota bacterium]